MTFEHHTALITGASSGIGYELAKIMAEDQWHLILAARRENLLIELAEILRRDHQAEVTVIAQDLGIPGGADELFRKVQAKGLRVNALVNNAGIGMIGAFKDADAEHLATMVELNVVALARLTRLFLPEMLARRQGWILNAGSSAGFMPMPYFNAYSATKAFVQNFTEALAVELRGSGVSATCLAPGPTRTGFFKTAGDAKRTEKFGWAMSDPPSVARAGYLGMLNGRRVVLTGMMAKSAPIFRRFLPRGFLMQVVARALKGN